MSPNKKRLLASFAVGFAILVADLAWRAYPVTEWLPLAGLVLLAFALANMALELQQGLVTSLDSSVVVAALLLYGPLGAGIAVCCSFPLNIYLRDRTPLSVAIRNSAAAFSAATISGFLVTRALQPFIPLRPMGAFSAVPVLAAGVAFVFAFQLLNYVDVALYFAFIDRQRFFDVLKSINPVADIPGNVLLAVLGFTLAVLVSAGSWAGAVLLLAPVAVVRRAFRVYADMASMYSSTLGALVSAIEAKDPYTKGHSERVAGIARKMGAAMKLNKNEVASLERAALLHDVGKIGVPGRILQCRGKLSDEDYALIQQHPTMAAEVLAHIDYVQGLLPIIRHHHEQVGGWGYPDGLKSEQIPALSKVLAVADAYDAMTSDRPYRPGMSPEEAVQELYRCSGTQFDPQAVEALAQVLQLGCEDRCDDATSGGLASSQRETERP